MISEKTKIKLLTILSTTLTTKQRKELSIPLIDLYEDITREAKRIKAQAEDRLNLFKGERQMYRDHKIKYGMFLKKYDNLRVRTNQLLKIEKKQDRKISILSKWINKKCKGWIKGKNKKLKNKKVKIRDKDKKK